MDSFSSLYNLPANVETRWASPENPDGAKGAGGKVNFGRKGRPNLRLTPGQQIVFAQAKGGSGMVRRIWATVQDRTPEVMRGLRISMYWDGATTPAVSAPFADFFGQGLGRCQTFESALFSNPEGRSFNCYIPMPFQNGFRIEVLNEAPRDALIFYDVDYTLGDAIETPSYLHAHWNREAPTTLLHDYEILPRLAGRGRYLGANFGVIVDFAKYFDSWWGEGECKTYLDGDTDLPSLVGTGTEDYIGTGWGQQQYANLYQGCHLADHSHDQFAFYRYHVPDAIYFQRDIRVTFQQIGGCSATTFARFRDTKQQLIGAGNADGIRAGEPLDMHPKADPPFSLFERADDWSSCCYFYLDRPENGLPALAPVAARTAGLMGA
jgi:hypothetical protein